MVLRRQFIEVAAELDSEELARYLRAFYISPDLVFKPPEIAEEEASQKEPLPEVLEALKDIEELWDGNES